MHKYKIFTELGKRPEKVETEISEPKLKTQTGGTQEGKERFKGGNLTWCTVRKGKMQNIIGSSLRRL